MAPLLAIASAALLFARASYAHFLLNFPPPVGPFNDDGEATAPCGGYTPDFSKNNVTNFSVDGQSISTLSSHPQVDYIYRITTDETASGNWTQIYPIFQQTGIGSLCIPKVTAPSSYVGQTAVLSIVANGPDGILYQCAAVKFVSGANATLASGCTNATVVTAAFTSDTSLAALVGSTATTNTTGSGGSTTSASPAATTSAKNAGIATTGSMEAILSLLVTTSMLAVGVVLMI